MHHEIHELTNNCDNVAASKREKQVVSSRLTDLAKCPGVCAVEGLKTLSLSLVLTRCNKGDSNSSVFFLSVV
jgi:hypothetical protein